jgi:hypothetical protein
MDVDPAAALVHLDILEAMPVLNDLVEDGKGRPSLTAPAPRDALINARVTNTANVTLCGISLWIYNFKNVGEYWSLLPELTEDGKEFSDVVTLPTRNSSLVPGQSHYFGVLIEDMQKGFPNLVVVKASEECGGQQQPR